MYNAAYYDRETYTYHVRDDRESWLEFKYQPTFYKISDTGKFPTLDGKMAFPTKKWEGTRELYERDVDKLTRVLVDLYYETDDVASYQNLVYLDIECEILGALTPESIRVAAAKLTSIALYDNTTKVKYCYIVDETKIIQSIDQGDKVIIPVGNEEELILKFLDKWEELDATIVTGWNSVFFDIPYLYYRIRNKLGDKQALRLSPLRKVKISNAADYKEGAERDFNIAGDIIELAGVNHLDYMLLFKKFVTKQEPSNKLGDIGEKYVKLGKIEYEGNLDRLFKEDIDTFINYNIRDVEILIALEDKLKFIDLAVILCHLCHVPYEQIYLSTALNDGGILTYLKRKGVVSPNKPTTINPSLKGLQQDYPGGYLKEPKPGLYEWVIDLDFTSLYPSIIRSLNMGIETMIGQILNTHKNDSNWGLKDLQQMDPTKLITIERITEERHSQRSQISVKEILEFIDKNDLFVAASGGLFRKDTLSVVCEVLTDWFNKRVEYKGLMKAAYKAGDKELGEFYNRRQHAYKIKLNDVYGCYAINGWRYTDGHKVISKAITLTGQRLTIESIKFVNQWLNKEIGTKDHDYIITSDTDSLYIHAKDLLIHRGVDIEDKQATIKATLEIATEIQKVANDNLNIIAKDLFNITNNIHHFELKQEVVLERGYFSMKRRYAMYIVNKEGVDVEELVIMGLNIMKSDMPKSYKAFGEGLIKDIMFGKHQKEIDKKIIEFKRTIEGTDYKILAKPTGVRKVREYIKKQAQPGEIFSILEKGTPINSRASIIYNDLLRFKQLDKKHPEITSGDKIKYVSLKPNPFKLDIIGFTGDNDPEFIVDFITTYVDKTQTFNNVLLNKLTSIYSDLSWSFPNLSERVGKFFKFG
jgi:DNA polymerase elongation subunit (family B)